MGMSSDELFECYPWGPGYRLAADANVYEFSFTLEPIEILGDLLSSLGLDENEGFNLRSFGCIDSYSGEPATHQSAFVLTEYESSFTLDSLEFLDTNLSPSMGSAGYEDFDTNDSWDPLYGGGGKGGSRTSQRVRAESQIQDQLIALATAVAELQRAQMGTRTTPKAGRAEARPSKPTTTRPRRQRRQREDIPIVAKLRSLLSVVDGGMNVTQTQVISKLREVISTFTPGASPSARDAPEAPQEKEPPQVRARLFQDPWGQAKIVTSSAVRASLEQSTEPMVILAATRAEYEQCERARKALGNRQNITYVVLDSNGPDSVLLEGQRGPRSAKANITYLSESAPKCAGLHAAMKDDEPVPATKLKLVNFRITISAEFADETLFHVASAEPQTTPALVLGDVLAERVLRTRGAIAYDAEVTCIVSTTEANAADFRTAVPPRGAFIMQQDAPIAPRWLSRRADEEDEEGTRKYYDRVYQLAQQRQGHMLYRPHGKAQLGVAGAAGVHPGEADAIKWHVRNAPAHMVTAQEFTTWATERGFQNVANAARAGARAWTFFGDTPAGVVATVHTFKSGAVVSRAFSKNGAPAKAARQATSKEARQRWGAPKASPQYDAAVAPPPAEERAAAPADAPSGAAAAAAAADGDPAGGARKAGAAPHEAAPPNKHAKGENGKPVPAGPSAPPFTKLFNVRACGGGGDCMYIAVAKGLAAITPSKSIPTADDFEPGGRLQGNLRLAAQEEALKKTFKATTADADKIGTTGTPASSLAVRLLAKRLNVDIYVWSRAPGAEQWVLYGRERGGKLRKKELWLKLEDHHYEWLQPKPDQQETTEYRQTLDCWREKALGYPTSGLQGKGRSLDPDAASILGIPAPSSRAASSRPPAPRLDPEAMSILGIPAPPSTAAASRAPARRPAAASSRGARSILGIPADDPDDETPVAYAKGDYLKCPCGQWAPPAPPAHLSGSQASAWQYNKATVHWRECQGAAPPRLKDQPGSVSRRAIQASFWARPAFREARRAKLFAAHLKWKAALPASVQPGVCSPDERTVSSKVLKGGGIQHHYTCSTCSKSTHLTQFRYYPCRARPATMTRLSMLTAMRGEEAANRAHQAESASRKRFAKTYATRRKELYKIRYADPEQRKTKRLKDKIRFARYRADQKRLSQERRTAKIAKKRPAAEVVNFTSTVARGTPPVPWCIAGDLNWRPSYVNALPTHAVLCAATTPTTLAGTSPTRAVGAGIELRLESVAFLPLIPHHGLVIFSAQVAAPSAQATRMRRTTRFTLDPGTLLLASDTEELQSHMDATLPACPAAAPLPERVATTPAVRPAEPMELVRLKRLGRRVAHQLRDHADELIAGPLLRQYVDSALRGRLTAGPKGRPTHAEAHGKISKAISAIQRDLLRDRRSEWRRLFQHFTTDTWRAATAEVHGPSECPSFNAEDMTEEWKRVWVPSDPNYDEQRCAARWEQYAAEAHEPLPKTANAYDEEWCPSYADFRVAVRKAKGSAGYDGWHSSELKLISEHFEFLLFELYTLWRDTCETLLVERPTTELQHLLFAWRVVGVPKKDPTQSRPIGVGSVLLRAWLTACEPSLPTPQDAQFACKAGSTVVHACCLWLHACQHGSCGLERDLSKCYDNVPHAVADAALRNAQTPRRVRAVTNAAWRGPRRCQVAGELAGETLWPTRSLAQGDSTAPKVLCHVLSPWEINGTKFLFMDDRSAVFDSVPQMESDVQATNAFDSGTGAIENVGKRQVWKRGDRTQIEHIGILAVPDAPDEPITPAGGWTKLRKCLHAIRGLPGGSEARATAVRAYAKPLWTWCSPVFSLPPPDVVPAAMSAVLSTRCTWWCRGRFWASNIDLHPIFSAVLTAIDRITTWDLRWSTFLEVNFTSFFDAIGFEFLQYDPERGVQFRRSVDEPDVRVRRLCGRRHIFWSDEEMVPHLLRQVCRARALAHASASRHDSEGVDQIDLEASSARAWSTFRDSLTLEDRIHLKIFRCGATHSPTRRWSTTRPDLTAACPSCGGPHRPSARHYVAECAALAGFRQELNDAYHIPPGWWARQPRATLKTGWITFPAHASAARRAELQVAVCRMGLVAMAQMAEDCEVLKRA
ncbi:unnamed protein product [Prorocentrum cordatum]|uniref:Reverse transcriptase domain-containing protein n=1 Tax=Prorocentrum cordatum TaxID=2364126 RepID=A0ABN9PX88_9DINO|nr:unnamed protein product [Polarella glacialis]